VAAGETLYAISRMYGLTVDQLKQLNRLTTNNIAIGQRLIVR
jgi:LysM repeat protein